METSYRIKVHKTSYYSETLMCSNSTQLKFYLFVEQWDLHILKSTSFCKFHSYQLFNFGMATDLREGKFWILTY